MTTYLNADLHCHSVVSDGTLAPEDLAARARANGVELLALTDHDEIGLSLIHIHVPTRQEAIL